MIQRYSRYSSVTSRSAGPRCGQRYIICYIRYSTDTTRYSRLSDTAHYSRIALQPVTAGSCYIALHQIHTSTLRFASIHDGQPRQTTQTCSPQQPPTTLSNPQQPSTGAVKQWRQREAAEAVEAAEGQYGGFRATFKAHLRLFCILELKGCAGSELGPTCAMGGQNWIWPFSAVSDYIYIYMRFAPRAHNVYFEVGLVCPFHHHNFQALAPQYKRNQFFIYMLQLRPGGPCALCGANPPRPHLSRDTGRSSTILHEMA